MPLGGWNLPRESLMPNGGAGSSMLGPAGPGGGTDVRSIVQLGNFLVGRMMDYVSRPKMVKKSFIWGSIVAFLGFSKKKF